MTKDIDHEIGQGREGKTCTKCGEWKLLDHYRKSAKGKNGLHSQCNNCARIAVAEWRINNPEAAKEKDRKSREKGADRIKLYVKKQYAENREAILLSVKAWAENNPEKKREYRKKYYADNKDSEKANSDRWRVNNPERWKEIAKKTNEKQLSTPKGKLIKTMRNTIWRGLSDGGKAGKRTFEALGYTVEELKYHLEKQFLQGMTWENYGRGGWVVDHKIPLSVHNFSTVDDIDFGRAWSLSNLQPMWERENISKGAKLFAPFQPSLAMSVYAENDNRPPHNEETA